MGIINIIKDKLSRNYNIYKNAWKNRHIMGIKYTCLLWKNHTKFLLRKGSPKDKFEEVNRVAAFMENNFGEFANQYSQLPVYDYDIEQDESWRQSKIWIYWNNPNSMSLLVKSCVDRIKQMSNGHEVVILSEKNVGDYVDIPSIVLRKYQEKKISLTHFSDFIRMAVLYKYGGLYLDVTTYPTRPFEEKFFKSPFFSNKIAWNPNDACVARCRWSSFMFGCRKENLLLKATLELFTEYWKLYDAPMDYLMIDYVWNLLYGHVLSVKEMIDNIPNNDINAWEQQTNLGRTCSEVHFQELMTRPEVDVYKFSYKSSVGCHLRDEHGEPTLLGRICGER